MMKKWTIGIVNYKTSIYIKWQLKCFYDFNDPAEFQLVIVDNSVDAGEFRALQDLAAPYQAAHNNITLVDHRPVEKTASGQHGEGLTLIMRDYADSTYLLFQDPDFFWVKQGILKWFEGFLERGVVAVGAPYPNKVGLGNPYFPCAYGCAHHVADLKGLDCYPNATEEAWNDSMARYPVKDGWDFSYDVGYKLREKLSSPDRDDNFISLGQRVAFELRDLIGIHSFETITREYFYRDQMVAYHLFRGSFTGTVNSDRADPNLAISDQWLQVRDTYGRLFYKTLCKNGKLDFGWRVTSLVYAKALVEFAWLAPLALFYPVKWVVRPLARFLRYLKNIYGRYVIMKFRQNLIFRMCQNAWR